MTDPYKVLGVSPTASDDEIKAAYRAQAKKYHPDNYDDDNPLKDLAKEKMQEINLAYDEIQRLRSGAAAYTGKGTYYKTSHSASGEQENNDPIYAQIRVDINSRKFAEAERKLLAVYPASRVAEWHYLMSLVLWQRKSVADSMRELEIACSMDPYNEEYQRAKEMFNNSAGTYGNTYYGSVNNTRPYGRTTSYDACDCCANLICLDCLCECMGGDLISCC